MDEYVEIRGVEGNGNDMRRRIRGPLAEQIGQVEDRLRFVAMKQQALKFRRQGSSRDTEASVRPTIWGERIEPGLTPDEQERGREQKETEQ
jgi:hypothetical protein